MGNCIDVRNFQQLMEFSGRVRGWRGPAHVLFAEAVSHVIVTGYSSLRAHSRLFLSLVSEAIIYHHNLQRPKDDSQLFVTFQCGRMWYSKVENTSACWEGGD